MKLVSILILILTLFIHNSYADNNLEFENWKKTFKAVALKNNISENTFNLVMSDVKFLPKVIEYDRYQPEFYEDTKTYISKRSSDKKVKKGVIFYKDQSELINKVEKKFDVEKELLLALMGIETNFGTYVGKMDILSSLATLSFDQRRSKFFTNEYFKKFIKNNEILDSLDENLKVAIITPDKDIVENADKLSPAYLVFDNYEIILKWNRSLRFALAVCTLKDKIKNEL